MDLNLQPLAGACFISGDIFEEGQRVVSLLVRNAEMAVSRYDVLESRQAELAVEGQRVCSWVQLYKPRQKSDNPDRVLKMTVENLFLTLADPSHEPSAETLRLIQFLALMLERKRILRPKGARPDDEGGTRLLYEHAKTKQVFAVPESDFSPEFFVSVQDQLSLLLGPPASPAPPAAPSTAAEPSSSSAAPAAESSVSALGTDAVDGSPASSVAREALPVGPAAPAEEASVVASAAQP